MTMQPGQHITPTLRLVQTLGKGGMGSVWIADHLGLSTRVAVKFLSPAFAENESIVERFRREAMAAAQIKSPHVAQVFDHGLSTDGAPYIVMELLEGEDLRHRVRRVGPLDPREVASIVTQVGKALTRAHQLQIVHRDIKPDNIFLVDLDGDLFVKVLDFGVAKLQTDDLGMTTTGNMVGTPLYMSPEQLLSAKHVDFRSDLWSLGVVAYYTLTGRAPFTGDTIGSLSVAVHAGVFVPPSTLRPGLPPAVDAWMQRVLRRDPAERFGSAKEMAEELWRAVMAPAAAPPAALPGRTVVQLPGETPAGAGRGSFPSNPLGFGATPPGGAIAAAHDVPARTLAGSATTSPEMRGTKSGKGVVVVSLVALLGLGGAGAGVWLFTRSNPPGASGPDAEGSPASAAETTPGETAPVTAAPPVAPAPDALPAAPGPEVAVAPAESQAPATASAPSPVPAAVVATPQKGAVSSQAATARTVPTAAAKPPPAPKRPAASTVSKDVGY